MSYTSPVGTSYFISKTFGSAITLATLSNANPAAAGSVGHGLIDDDIVLYEGGWERATLGLYKINQTSVDAFELLKLNATSTSLYPAGSGVGTVKKVTTWIELPQVVGIATNGGDPRNFEVRPIKNLQGIMIPDGFNAASTNLTFGWDPDVANFDALQDISRGQEPVAYKKVKGTKVTYGYGLFSMSTQASQQAGREDQGTFQIAMQGPMTNY